MYDYFCDKAYLKRAKKLCSSIVSEVEIEVRNKGMNCQFFLIGSGARNMVTYIKRRDGKIYIDFDYNLNILSCNDWNDGKTIKETVRKAFNKVWRKLYNTECAQDSKSSITSDEIHFKDVPNVSFSIDLGIVTLDAAGKWQRLIHDKYAGGGYHWDPVRYSENVSKKAEILKNNYHWDGREGVRERYLEIKNRYASQQDDSHPSFICYIEAVNEIYQKWGKK